jgi:hypothetical protein
MKRLTLNEQRDAALEMRARLLAPPPNDAPVPSDARARTWAIVMLLASLLVGGGLALTHVVTFHVPSSVVDAVWPSL